MSRKSVVKDHTNAAKSHFAVVFLLATVLLTTVHHETDTTDSFVAS